MRILTVGNMYPPHHLGGYELMWQSSVRHLRSHGHEVRVLTTDYRSPASDPGPDDGDVRRDLPWYWHDHAFPRLSLRERLHLERTALAVLEENLVEFRPKVVAWWAMGGMSMSLLEHVRRHGPPAVGVVVDDWLVYGPKVDAWQRTFGRPVLSWAAEALTRVPARLRLDRSAAWLCVSARVRDRAAREGLRLEGATIAHAGIDEELFHQVAPKDWEGRLLCLGRIDPRKGVAVAIRALADLPTCELTVIGAGDAEHLAELQELARAPEVAGRVRFETRSRQEIPAAIAESDALLFPVQWEEPWGLVPIEAMAVGRPVIATGTGGSAEYLRDDENCLIYAPKEDSTALADRVRALGGDPALRERLRNGGCATASLFTERQFNDAVMAALESA